MLDTLDSKVSTEKYGYLAIDITNISYIRRLRD